MHWLIRPAIGWGAWILLHSVAIPLIYGLGKKDCKLQKRQEVGES